MKQRKSLGMGGDPSQRMFSTARELLWRQRVIHEFPCDRDDVLCSLLPKGLSEYIYPVHADGLGGDICWQNLTHCVNLGFTTTVEIDGETGRAFWFGWSTGKPAPVRPDTAFAMHPSCPYYGEIVEWWGPAMETHKRLMQYEQALHDFFSRASHPALVKKYWPDLHKFVNFPLSPNQAISEVEMSKRRVVPMPTAEDADGIIETLAGSTLLEPHKCNAWVDYETEDW